MAMVRKQLYLPANVDRELMAEAKRRGISQAELIRERLHAQPVVGAAIPNPAAREWLLNRLRTVNETAASGAGTGWRFERDEIYAERLEQARAAGHERPGQRRGRTRAG